MHEQNDPHHARLELAIDQLTDRVDQLMTRIELLENKQAPDQRPISSTKPPPLPLPPLSKPITTPIPRSAPSSVLSKPNPDADARGLTGGEPIRVRRPSPQKPSPPRKEMHKPAWLSGTRGLIFAMSLIGVVIFIISIGLFFKLAVDNGWIAKISPTMRVSAAIGFGLALVGVGEVLRRKINALASSGASAAGIATIYAAIYASSKLYELIDTPAAFALMVVVTILGVLLGSLSNRVALALLSLIAAFLVPVLLSTGEPSYVVLPAYLLSLLTLGLVLSGWRGGSYSYVRKLAWWGTGLLGTLWLVDAHSE
ncbi:MAG: DUF2339 domain-containing protein, partial [Phycisphaerales bacterium]|nr:DUF2339 domain-containing protein [Phycisphaerales bacterium]